MKAINIEDDFYFRGSDFEALLPAGKRWLHASEGGPTLSMAQYFAFLGATREMEKVGSEAIRGVATDHFDGTVDYDTFAETLGLAAPAEFDDGTPSEDFELRFGVWLDADDSVRRLKIGAAVAGTPQRLDIALDVTEYDTGILIQPPPAAQVADRRG